MNHLQNIKYVPITPPGAIVDNTAFTTTEVDTRGWRKMRVYVQLGATDIAIAAFKLTHSDSSGSGHEDITGATYAGDLPTATDDNKTFVIEIDLRGKKRYVDLTLTAGDGSTGTYAVAFALLSDPEESPNSAAERGVEQEVYA